MISENPSSLLDGVIWVHCVVEFVAETFVVEVAESAELTQRFEVVEVAVAVAAASALGKNVELTTAENG